MLTDRNSLDGRIKFVVHFAFGAYLHSDYVGTRLLVWSRGDRD